MRRESDIRADAAAASELFLGVSGASGNQMDLRPNQLMIFGSGGLVPALISANPAVAIDLPIKVLAWEDKSGKVWVSFNVGGFLKNRHSMTGADDAVSRLTALSKSFVDKALQ